MKHKILLNRNDIVRLISDYLLNLYDGFYVRPVVKIENDYDLGYSDIIATVEESDEQKEHSIHDEQNAPTGGR